MRQRGSAGRGLKAYDEEWKERDKEMPVALIPVVGPGEEDCSEGLRISSGEVSEALGDMEIDRLQIWYLLYAMQC